MGNADALVFFMFDLLYLDGDEISSAPLLERKSAYEAFCRIRARR
jgi:ATP-dependent DNA ligase